jgi:hypothetical protein
MKVSLLASVGHLALLAGFKQGPQICAFKGSSSWDLQIKGNANDDGILTLLLSFNVLLLQ